jgi:hypothetical protein
MEITMSILSRIISVIETRIYPRVKATVDAVVGTAETLAQDVEDVVVAGAQKVEAATEEIAQVILASPPARERIRVTLEEARADHKTETGEDLDYLHSIVDLLKLIGEDSSFYNRKKLAAEFGMADYKGSADQNQRLSAMVMEKLT